MAAPRFTARQRRDRLVRRHHLDGSATGPEQAARSVVALHATEPASVYLSVLARCPSSTLDDVAAALHDQRSLVRVMAMRRTMFAVPVDRAPVLHAAVGLEVSERIRRSIVRQLTTLPTEPTVDSDVDGWLDDVGASTLRALDARGTATAAQLSTDEPRLRTAILPTTDKSWDVRRTLTTHVMTWLGARGHAVRGRPRGGWTSQAHTWEPASRWWPDGIPDLDAGTARTELARAWLQAFAPATVDDLRWWTGWSLRTTRAALAPLDTVEVDLDGVTGMCLAADLEPEPASDPRAVLLPALDPTPMGWTHRGWLFAADRTPWFDTNGNLGPTVWWDGEVVGGWLLAAGRVRWKLLADRGKPAEDAVAAAAAALEERLDEPVTVRGYPTPLEAELRSG